MFEFSKDKWKLLSFGLMAILATGFIAPQAFAAGTKDVLSIVTDIQTAISDPTNGLQAIQNNVNTKASQSSISNLQSTANNIQNSVNNLQTSVKGLNSSPNSLAISNATTLTPFGSLGDNLQVVFLPQVNNRTYSGHITMSFEAILAKTDVNIACNNPGGSVVLFNHSGLNGIDSLNTDFACTSLTMAAVNHDTVNGSFQFSGVIQYQNSTNVSTKLPVFQVE